MIASIQPYYVAVLFQGCSITITTLTDFLIFLIGSTTVCTNIFSIVIVVLISPVFLGLLYSRSMGYNSTLLQEGWGKGDGWGGGRALHDIPKMAAKEVSFYMQGEKRLIIDFTKSPSDALNYNSTS